MSKPLDGKHFLIFVGDEYEDLELWYPKLRLLEAGAGVTVAGAEVGRTYRGKHGYPCVADGDISEMEAADFDGVICPGGWMPDKLRRDPKVLDLVREFHKAERLIAAICHGGWIPISAGVYEGVRVTGSPGIKDDLINAGATWVDESAFRDRNLVWGRVVEDIPAFCRELVASIAGILPG
jgi:protease I